MLKLKHEDTLGLLITDCKKSYMTNDTGDPWHGNTDECTPFVDLAASGRDTVARLVPFTIDSKRLLLEQAILRNKCSGLSIRAPVAPVRFPSLGYFLCK